MKVPIDHDNPELGQLELGFARLPGRGVDAGTPPLFVLAGGPGQAATDLAAIIDQRWSEIARQRDIVLVDQRGTGRSSPLACDLLLADPFMPRAEFVALEDLSACLAQLPPTFIHYGTEQAVRDFDAVRRALGYDRIQLYGGSYGSRAAFAYLAVAPDSVDRVVLDGVAPPSVAIGLFGRSAAAAFNRVLRGCAQNPMCAEKFPDTQAQLADVLQRFEDTPLSVQLPHPTTGESQSFTLYRSGVLGLLRLLLYDANTTVLVPLVIDRLAQEDYRPLAGLFARVMAQEAINPLVNLLIVCNEDWPEHSPQARAQDAANSFDGDSSHRLWAEVCPHMPRYPRAPTLDYDYVTDVPALLLSGRGDPVTPPEHAEAASAWFTRAQHFVDVTGAHIVGLSACGEQVVADFLDGVSPSELDGRCFAEGRSPALVIDNLGSTAPILDTPSANSDGASPRTSPIVSGTSTNEYGEPRD